MEHPFINNLSDKTLEELQTTISSLTSKLTYAYRTSNGPLVTQLQMAITSHRNAYDKKMDDIIAKQNVKSSINIEKKN